MIAFILQDGAGRGGSAFSNSSVIAKVNGTSIERGAFEERLKSQEAMYAGQGATRDQLIGTVYNMEVDNIVLNQEFEKLGLIVSAKELNDILFGENHSYRFYSIRRSRFYCYFDVDACWSFVRKN